MVRTQATVVSNQLPAGQRPETCNDSTSGDFGIPFRLACTNFLLGLAH